MAETKSLAASVRSGVGKGAARSVRREGRIPAVIYGGGEPPQPIALSWHEVNKLIYAGGFMTTTFELEIDGVKERVIPRDYQLERISDRPLHVDFLRLKRGQKIDVDIPVHIVGQDESLGLKQGGALTIALHAIGLNVSADAIPDHIEVDVSKLTIGDSIHVSDLRLPRGARLAAAIDPTLSVLTIAPPLEEEAEAAAETPAEGDETASDAAKTEDDSSQN
jgi:large subunit ribosomal protein L25